MNQEITKRRLGTAPAKPISNPAVIALHFRGTIMQHAALNRAPYVDCRMRGVGSHRFMTARATESFGRLVRASRCCGDRNAVAYIVAAAKASDAMEIIRTKIAEPGYMIEDLGRVSDAVLRSLNLSSGEFVRTDALRRA
jgi:hypothetical protein